MVGKVQGGRGPVELGAGGVAPAAAVKTENMRETENEAQRD